MGKKRKYKKQFQPINNMRTFESDEHFAFIVGYTENGFAFGIRHEEMQEIVYAELGEIINQEFIDDSFHQMESLYTEYHSEI